MKHILINITVLLIIAGLFSGCKNDSAGPEPPEPRDYRRDMREFVQNLSNYARTINPGFIIIPQNGQELLTKNGEADGEPVTDYLDAITGVGREDLFYGYTGDNVATPVNEYNYMLAFLETAKQNNKKVLVIDYCTTRSYVDRSYAENSALGFISFAASHRELDNIPDYPPQPYNVNSGDIVTLANAKNFLYLINPGSFADKNSFLQALRETNYDLIFIDLFYDGSRSLSATEISSLKTKTNGGSRLVIAYLSIGEAEDYRYYWKDEWKTKPPSWLDSENPNWPGNYKVRYWEDNWQSIIFGNDQSYLARILNAGFDGVYLDLVDSYWYFEN
ncbi:endo alpha-1,4 polygalactosaminidase [candidate division KSB1 bacterium]|nr:endo alpha-1,4 polygalactosaminidase [candidate division KSB1 bacterium]